MSTVSLCCFSPLGIVLVDPAGTVASVTLKGPAQQTQQDFTPSAPRLNQSRGHRGGVSGVVTSGVDAGLWTRWSAAYPNLVGPAVSLASTP
jgi:hypothetical protein